MSEFTSVKYRIPVVNRKVLYLCTRCGLPVEFEVASPELDIYESPHGRCEPCQGLVELEDGKDATGAVSST